MALYNSFWHSTSQVLKEALQNHEFWPPQKHHLISIQYLSRKCLPEKSWLHCLRILVMSWLFKHPVVIMKENHALTVKDPITVTWLNLTMPNQTVKSSLKAKKIELPQMNFVLENQLIKFSCTYQPLSICQIFIKKILELIQSYDNVCHFSDQNSPFALNKIF